MVIDFHCMINACIANLVLLDIHKLSASVNIRTLYNQRQGDTLCIDHEMKTLAMLSLCAYRCSPQANIIHLPSQERQQVRKLVPSG